MLKLNIHRELEAEKRQFVEGWTERDYEYLSNEKALEKLHRSFDKSAYHFNVDMFLKGRGGLVTPGQVNSVDILDDHINVVMGNNVTTEANWMPTNRWIICHRIAHCLSSNPTGFFDQEYTMRDAPEFDMWLSIFELWHFIHGIEDFTPCLGETVRSSVDIELLARYRNPANTTQFTAMEVVESRWLHMFISNLFTMKSARERKMANNLDVFAEATAQYLTTGKFKLNRWADMSLSEMRDLREWQPHSSTDWGQNITGTLKKNPRLHYMQWNPDTVQFDERIAEAEERINAKFKIFADRLVGRQVFF